MDNINNSTYYNYNYTNFYCDKRLKEIDDKGMFYADDQIGFFFKEVQKMQEALNEFTLK